MRAFVLPVVLLFQGAVAQQWQQLPDFPGTARDDAASFSIAGVIYVGTGMEVGWGLTNDWYAFDTQTETWSTIASLPATPRQYCTTFIDRYSNKGYLFGGVDGNGALNELWEYDPDSDQWTQRASLPAEARFACVGWDNTPFTALCHVVTGMLASGVPTNELWAYDPQANTWSQRLSLPGIPRHRAMGAASAMNWVFGGADQNFDGLRDVWSYDPPPSEIWFLHYDSLAQPRYEGKVALGLDYLDTSSPFVICGATMATNFLDDVLYYPQAAVGLPAFPGGGRRGGVAGRDVYGQNIYFGTGLNEGSERQNDWWRLGVEYLGVDEAPSSFSVYPNPGTEGFTVASTSPLPTNVVIVNTQGQEVSREKIRLDGHVDMQVLSGGLYHVRLIDQMGRGTSIRWIKL